jgi:pyruvate kinase|tara:strand:+ start:23 stop:1075 length:1053 start_codon:yes stop_codon:yes gene_type:complete
MATPAAYTPSKSAGGSGLAAVRARSGSVNHGRGIPHGNIDLAMIQGTEPSSEITVPRKTKIVCTIGPACWSVETLTSMLGLGMTVARLNFSHGDHEGHGSCLDRLREAASSCGTNDGANLAIMMDTKGPEIRTGRINADKVTYLAGSEISITTDYDVVGDETTIACSYKSLCTIAVGQKMLVADGSLVLEVLTADAAAGIVTAKVLNTASIGSFKNMNLPGVIVDLPTMTERDANDIANFAVTREVDMIAASFVRKGSDVEAIRKVIADACVAQGKPASLAKSIKIISKIENQEGLENFADILIASDGIMVARGDLGMELPPEKVFLAQKFMIRQCNIAGKPVITATQVR